MSIPTTTEPTAADAVVAAAAALEAACRRIRGDGNRLLRIGDIIKFTGLSPSGAWGFIARLEAGGLRRKQIGGACWLQSDFDEELRKMDTRP